MNLGAILVISGSVLIIFSIGLFTLFQKYSTAELGSFIDSFIDLITTVGLIVGVILLIFSGRYMSSNYVISYKDDDGMTTIYNVTDIHVQGEYVEFKVDDDKYLIKSDFIKIYEYEEDK